MLREAWYGAKPVAEIAAEVRASGSRATEAGIKMFWRREKEAGRLPMRSRDNVVAREAVVVQPVDDDDALLGCLPVIIPAGDPLLDALRKHHGKDDRATRDAVPDFWLRRDAVRGAGIPSRNELVRMQRIADAMRV